MNQPLRIFRVRDLNVDAVDGARYQVQYMREELSETYEAELWPHGESTCKVVFGVDGDRQVRRTSNPPDIIAAVCQFWADLPQAARDGALDLKCAPVVSREAYLADRDVDARRSLIENGRGMPPAHLG
jgi:hypothetical protein